MSHKVFIQFTPVELRTPYAFKNSLIHLKNEFTNLYDYIAFLPNTYRYVEYDSRPDFYVLRKVECVDSFCPLFLKTLSDAVANFVRNNAKLPTGEPYLITWNTTHTRLTEKAKQQLTDAIVVTFVDTWLAKHSK